MADSSGASLRAILFALGANAGIAITKFGAALYTGSGAMLAEAIHSVADCANQLLLLVGMRQARRPESAEHPLGQHRAVYYWSMIVALLLFFVGGAFSVYEGISRLLHPEPLKNAPVALAVLGIAVVLEAASLWGAMREIRKVQGARTFWRWFRETRQSELMVVAGEDIAALLGLVFAFIAIAAAMVTGNPALDALGSVAVGVLLMVVAIAVLQEIKAMIIGESAEPAVRAAIRAHIEARREVRNVISLITLQWGEKLIVAVQAEMHDPGSAAALIAAINDVEASIQQAFPQARWVFFEPDVRRKA
ncbi:MAG: cation diffusion facilitator family transporter [Gemmatimonadota bacterium]